MPDVTESVTAKGNTGLEWSCPPPRPEGPPATENPGCIKISDPGTDDIICRAAVETDAESRLGVAGAGGEGGVCGEGGVGTRAATCEIDSQRGFAVCHRGHKPELCNSLERCNGRFTSVCLWLIHANLWQFAIV